MRGYGIIKSRSGVNWISQRRGKFARIMNKSSTLAKKHRVKIGRISSNCNACMLPHKKHKFRRLKTN